MKLYEDDLEIYHGRDKVEKMMQGGDAEKESSYHYVSIEYPAIQVSLKLIKVSR